MVNKDFFVLSRCKLIEVQGIGITVSAAVLEGSIPFRPVYKVVSQCKEGDHMCWLLEPSQTCCISSIDN